MQQIKLYNYAVLDYNHIVIQVIQAPNDFQAYMIAKENFGHYYNIYVSRIK